MEEFIEIFIKNKQMKYQINILKELINFCLFTQLFSMYGLAYLFAYLHFSYNSLFEFLIR